jgi:hypothetical protein
MTTGLQRRHRGVQAMLNRLGAVFIFCLECVIGLNQAKQTYAADADQHDQASGDFQMT